MNNFLITLRGYLGYRGREGQIGFMLHRITGLGTFLFLAVHILDTALVYFSPLLYESFLQLYRSLIFGIGELLLVFCVFYHGANGLRIAFFDLFAPKYWNISSQRRSVWVTLAIALVLWIPAAALMVRGILIHKYGLLGG